MRVLKRVALVLLLSAAVLAGVFIYLLSPAVGEATVTDFAVVPGTPSAQISQELAEKKLVRSSFAFYLYLKLIGGKILPGVYELSAADSGSEIALKLALGRFKTAKITIIEGWRATQIEKYLVTERRLSQFAGFAAIAESYEGYLFPDTYEIKVDETTEGLIKKMRETFEIKTKGLRITPETVILASIVEREAASDEDRPLIAGVYTNRIKRAMLLEADPTIQYGKGDWVIISRSDYLNFISPYNTYLHGGWPPGPIASPGLKSLQAAAAPAGHDYLYFFHAKGQTYFSRTAAEHAAKVRQYF